MATNDKVTLRQTVADDLAVFFGFQLDQQARHLAAFTSKDSTDETAYLEKHRSFLRDRTIHMRTICVGDVIAGSIAKFLVEGDAEITFWIDRRFWGQGVASRALADFLEIEKSRPLFGRAAFDNFGSQKVLEKCGFVKIGRDRGFANARQTEIEEFIYQRCE